MRGLSADSAELEAEICGLPRPEIARIPFREFDVEICVVLLACAPREKVEHAHGAERFDEAECPFVETAEETVAFQKGFFETSSSVIDSVKKAYESLDTDYALMVGTIASGDQFISSKEKKEFIENTFAAAACEMEGASLAQVCSDNGVPFLVIRAISDKADGEAPLSYNDFKEKAIVNLTELVKKVI